MRFIKLIVDWIEKDRQSLQDRFDRLYGEDEYYVEQSSDRSVFYDVYDKDGKKVHSGLFAKLMSDIDKLIFRRRK